MAERSDRLDMFRLGGIELFYWMAIAVGNYIVVFLQKQGYSASEIGMINAVNSAIVLIASPLWGVISDKVRSIKKVFLLTITISIILFPMVAAAAHLPKWSSPVVIACIIVCFFFRNPAQSLMDSMVVQNCNVKRIQYGPARAMGSISYAIASIILSFILPYIGIEITFYVYPLFMLPCILLSIAEPEVNVGPRKSLSFKELHIEELIRNYAYMTFLMFVFIYSVALNAGYNFLPFLMEHIGEEGSRYSMLTGYRAFLEAPALFLIVFLRKRFKLQVLIVMAVVCFSVEPFLLTLCTGIWQMLIVTTIYGIGSGLMIGSATNYCFSIAPDRLKATAMTLYGTVGGLSGIVGNLAGGSILDQYGVIVLYRVMSICSFSALGFYLITTLIGRRLKKIN